MVRPHKVKQKSIRERFKLGLHDERIHRFVRLSKLKPGDVILRPSKIHTELYRQPAEGYRQYTYGASNPALRPDVPKGE